ncbi:MAG: peptide chain release factor-like protein, partial [Planctomycetota bacterium]
SQCSLTLGRTSGPGGQHRNKVSTAVEIVHCPTGVRARASERRSVKENRPVAIRRLRLALATEVRVGVPAGEIRSDLWKSRCRDKRIVCNPRHRDYPALLAEALDVLEACGFDSTRAAMRMCCSVSQLHKLVARHPPAWQLLNQRRVEHGHRPLKSPRP